MNEVWLWYATFENCFGFMSKPSCCLGLFLGTSAQDTMKLHFVVVYKDWSRKNNLCPPKGEVVTTLKDIFNSIFMLCSHHMRMVGTIYVSIERGGS